MNRTACNEQSLEISDLAAVGGAACMRCPKLSKGQMEFLHQTVCLSCSVCVYSQDAFTLSL